MWGHDLGVERNVGKVKWYPQSRGQAFTADNQKRSYGFKAKPFIPILFATMLKKNTAFQHFYLKSAGEVKE